MFPRPDLTAFDLPKNFPKSSIYDTPFLPQASTGFKAAVERVEICQMTSFLPADRPLPSTTAIAIATAIIAGLGGYFIGQASSIGLFSSSSTKKDRSSSGGPKKSWPNSYDVTVHPDSSDEELMTYLRGGKAGAKGRGKEVADSEDDESDSDGGDRKEAAETETLSTFDDNREECKLVLCVRTDLGMGKGTSIGYIFIYQCLSSELRQAKTCKDNG